MGDKMAKDDVIYGQGAGVKLAQVNWNTIESVIAEQIGPDEKISGLSDAKDAVVEAKKDKELDEAYVKVGLIKNNLVFRIKAKTSALKKDIEKDTPLIKGYREKRQKYLDNQTIEINTPETKADPKLIEEAILRINRRIEDNSFKPEMKKALELTKNSLKEKKLDQARQFIGKLHSMIQKALAELRDPGKLIRNQCNDVKIDPRNIDVGMFIKKIEQARKGLLPSRKTAEEYEMVLEKLEEKEVPVQTPSRQDGNYPVMFNNLLQAYKNIEVSCREHSLNAQGFAKKGVDLAGHSESPQKAEVASEFLRMAEEFEGKLRQCHVDFEVVQAPMRLKSGICADILTMVPQDKTDVFLPFQVRCMALGSKIQRSLETFIDAIDPVALDIAKRFPELKSNALELRRKISAPLKSNAN